MAHAPGKLIVLSGPSGVGKGTLRNCICSQFDNLVTSISATTRPQRSTETEGVDYFFLSRSEFEAQIAQGAFLEWAEYAGNFYGTPRAFVESNIAQGKLVLLEIEVQGALSVKQVFPQAEMIFIAPPSLEALASRLARRNTDQAADIAKRLEAAQWELTQTHAFDSVLINDDLETCTLALTQRLQSISP